MQELNRIKTIDGFRAIAIMMVIFFHFFSRWTFPVSNINLYPYKNRFNYFTMGRLGVHFFFMISGFVIFMTLEKTESFRLFMVNRFLRLMPSMITISLVTFLAFRI